MSDDHLELGRAGERAAVRHLKRLGYRILETNVELPGGELDVVARHKGVVCVVEVRARLGDDVREALESVDLRKRRKLVALARAYLAGRKFRPDTPVRFDVAAVTFPEGDLDRPRVTLVTDAISTDDLRPR